MKRYLKLGSAALGIIAVIMMFFTQVTVAWNSGAKEALGVQALVGGTYKIGTTFNGASSALAGYILIGVGALIVLASALVPLFKEHDMLSMVVTGLGVVCIIIGVILVFMVRKSFADANGYDDIVKLGGFAIAAGVLGSLSALGGAIGMFMDLAGVN